MAGTTKRGGNSLAKRLGAQKKNHYARTKRELSAGMVKNMISNAASHRTPNLSLIYEKNNISATFPEYRHRLHQESAPSPPWPSSSCFSCCFSSSASSSSSASHSPSSIYLSSPPSFSSYSSSYSASPSHSPSSSSSVTSSPPSSSSCPIVECISECLTTYMLYVA